MGCRTGQQKSSPVEGAAKFCKQVQLMRGPYCSGAVVQANSAAVVNWRAANAGPACGSDTSASLLRALTGANHVQGNCFSNSCGHRAFVAGTCWR